MENCFICEQEGKVNTFIRGKAGKYNIPLCTEHLNGILKDEISLDDLEVAYENEKRRDKQ